MKVEKIFAENGKDGYFSWRKVMTASAVVCFMTSVIGYLITHDFGELPASYQAIIAGVFVFYFGKNILSNTKISTKES